MEVVLFKFTLRNEAITHAFGTDYVILIFQDIDIPIHVNYFRL